MNNLVNSIAKEVAAATDEDRPTDPHEAEKSQFLSMAIVELSLPPLMVEDVETEIKDAFDSHGVPYVRDISLIDDIGERTVQEIDLLIRLLNPETQFNPEWLQESEEPTILAKITNRDDLTETYRDHLVETYEISRELASDLVEIIVAILDSYEDPIIQYYS